MLSVTVPANQILLYQSNERHISTPKVKIANSELLGQSTQSRIDSRSM